MKGGMTANGEQWVKIGDLHLVQDGKEVTAYCSSDDRIMQLDRTAVIEAVSTLQKWLRTGELFYCVIDDSEE